MPPRLTPIGLAGTLALTIMAGSFAAHASANDRVTVVQPGQTLGQIAVEHGISLQRLLALNEIADPNWIYPGQRIRLRAAARPRHGHTAPVTHRVAYGETLTGIAARYRTSIEALVRRNHLADASRIYVGQLLRVSSAPAPRQGHRHARAAHHPGHRPYVVRFGDTISGIAMRFRVSVESIVVENRLADASFIRVGQELRVPGRGSRAPAGGRARRARMPDQMAVLVRARRDIRGIIAADARRQGVPPSFAMAVAWQESGWQPHIVSSAGAIGVMQLLPSTADWVASTMLGERVNLWDARSNVHAGVRLLKHYLQHYRGNRSLALAAYYQGQAGTDRHGIYPVSRSYIASILLLQAMFGG